MLPISACVLKWSKTGNMCTQITHWADGHWRCCSSQGNVCGQPSCHCPSCHAALWFGYPECPESWSSWLWLSAGWNWCFQRLWLEWTIWERNVPLWKVLQPDMPWWGTHPWTHASMPSLTHVLRVTDKILEATSVAVRLPLSFLLCVTHSSIAEPKRRQQESERSARSAQLVHVNICLWRGLLRKHVKACLQVDYEYGGTFNWSPDIDTCVVNLDFTHWYFHSDAKHKHMLGPYYAVIKAPPQLVFFH